MGMMLTFAEAAWTQARSSAVAGKRGPALAKLAPLLHSPDVPARFRLLAHRLAARLHAAAGRYKACRKHLYSAFRLDGRAAEIHFEIGQAFEADPDGCDRRARRRFRLAVELAPRQPRYLAALGRAEVRLNRVKAGVALLREARDLAPTDATVLRVVFDGLMDAGKPAEARGLVDSLRFAAQADRDCARLVETGRFRLGQQRRTERARPRLRLARTGGGETWTRDAGHASKGPRLRTWS